MTNRLSKWSIHSSRMVCLLVVCGLMYACKDEFILDDEKPSFLNSSIYESLEQKGNFRTYLKLLADKEVNPEGELRQLTEILSRTGSKTIFVANDSAWDAFFAANAKLPESNPWHYATSYEKLSQAQKLLLIHTSMLNNAIVMENLASSETSGTSSPTRGEYMRRYTDVEATDSITYVAAKDLPRRYIPDDREDYEKDYWEPFRIGGKGIYLVTDSTQPMMLHFTAEHMARNIINDNDFEMFMGRPRNPSDVHIYDALLKEKDGVCENGYLNVTEKPLCPLTNMAEAIRINGKTNIFSHILDRFSAPFYCPLITERYQSLHPSFDQKIFTKRYFSENNFSVKGGYVRVDANGAIPKFEPDPEPDKDHIYKPYMPYKENAPEEKKNNAPSLKYDPGWNGYYDEVDVRKDMAAILVPNDEQMWKYFTQGGGAELILEFYANQGTDEEIEDYTLPTTVEELYQQIDCIPLDVIAKFVNNCMQRTFVGSVPSKWGKLTDDAQDPLFEDVDEAIGQLDTCLVCSNGVVYIMDRTCMPVDYRCVTAPAVISQTNKIINSAIYKPFMKLNYYAYLRAMQSRFTFLLPSDKALGYYYDPASMKSRTPRVLKFSPKPGKDEDVLVKAKAHKYIGPYPLNGVAPNPNEIGTHDEKTAITGANGTIDDSELINRLKDILESHTIVHDGSNPLTHTGKVGQDYWGVGTSKPLDEYFLSKNGNAVKVTRDANDNVIAVQGGFQLENERQGISSTASAIPGVTTCKVEKTRLMDNGNTYVLNAPLVPTYRSVWSIFTNDYDQFKEAAGDTPYTEFYDLCRADGYENEIIGCGLVDGKLDKTKQTSALKKFKVFVPDNGLDQNVQFFNNYRYTIFVPTNEAVRNAIAHGLPTWEDIYDDYHTHCKPAYEDEEAGIVKLDDQGKVEYTNELQSYEDSVRIAAKITYLTNFIRYHFADNSVFADKTELDANEMVTSSYDKELELFCKIHVDRVASGGGTELRVCDDATYKANGNRMEGADIPLVTLSEYNGEDVKNILARDISCSKSPVGVAMNKITLDSSSAAVIHLIPGCLNHVSLIDGDHTKTWESTVKAKQYLKRYAIR